MSNAEKIHTKTSVVLPLDSEKKFNTLFIDMFLVLYNEYAFL